MIENNNKKVHTISMNDKSQMRWTLQSKQNMIINVLAYNDKLRHELGERLQHVKLYEVLL